MHRPTSSFWIRLAVTLVFAVSPAWGVDGATRAATRELGTEGVQAYQAGDYATARTKLDEAFSIMRTAPLGLWSARALEKSGLLVEASERYLAAQRAAIDPEGDAQPQEEAKTTAASERAALLPRIPKLTVRISGPDPSEVVLTVAGDEVPSALVGKSLPVNPGHVEVVARRGEEEVTGSAELAEGEAKEVVLTLSTAPLAAAADEPAAAEPEKSSERSLMARKWPAFVAAGVAVAGGVIWTVFGVQSMDAKSQADLCDEDPCMAGVEDGFRQQAWDAGNMATVGMVMTGVGLVGAGVLWFTLPGADGPKDTAMAQRALSVGPLQRLQVGVRPGGIQLRGAF